MTNLPTGTITLLLTDIEGSTRLLHGLGSHYAEALAAHRDMLRLAFKAWDGHEVDTQGDSFFFVFARARHAVAAAADAQRALSTYAWPEGHALRVRLGLHTGEPARTAEGYVGLDVHHAARLMASGHGGQILLSQSTADLIRHDLPRGLSLRELGEHQLRDLDYPERIYQLLAADLPADFPPLRTPTLNASNLPVQLTSFVGREQELADVQQALATTHLLTLTGAGGIGKTRLALEVAQTLAGAGAQPPGSSPNFRDGVWRVELAPLSDPTLVAQAVASALEVREEPGRSLPQTLAAQLRSKSLLLLLDNCEHLIEACATLAELLLHGCPSIKILATSREALGVAGEVAWRVPSLDLPNPRRLPPVDLLARYAAIQLFVDRAHAAQSSFALTAQNAPAVAQVCSRLDGIPLAIELAAARVKALSVDQIAARLDDRFRLLTGGSRTALPRQQTLRAAIDWSYDLLPEAEQTVLRRLSVFAGGFRLDAAERVAGMRESAVNPTLPSSFEIRDLEILDLLAHLVDKSLVLAEEGEGAEDRYRLLETVRQYAQEKLFESGEATAVRGRHRDFYLELVEQAEPMLRGPEQERSLEQLEAEHDNLRAALEWSDTEEHGAAALVRQASALLLFWEVRGHLSEGRRWLERALQATEGMSSPARAEALNGAGVLARHQGDYAEAARLLEQSLALNREAKNNDGVALQLTHLGAVARRQGDYARAAALIEESLAIRRGLADERGIAQSLMALGVLAREQAQDERALELFEESLGRFRRIGDTQSMTIALTNLGVIARQHGEIERARDLFRESLDLSWGLGNKQGIVFCLAGLGAIAALRGDREGAARLLSAAETLLETIGARLGPVDRADYDGILAALRAQMTESDFAAAWEAGRELLLEQAVADALEGVR